MDIHIPIKIGTFTDAQAQIITGVILSFITPYLTALFTRRKMSDGTKVFIAGVMAFIMAVLTMVLTKKDAELTDIAVAFGLMWPLSQTFFKTIALKLGVRRVEELTTPVADRPTSQPLPTTSTAEAAAAIITETINAPQKVTEAVVEALPSGTPEAIVTMTREQVSELVGEVLERARKTIGS